MRKIETDGLSPEEIKQQFADLKAGDTILLSGKIYTARDAAHKKIKQALDQREPLPFDLNGAILYYAGPTPEKEGMVIGSCGPTTSSRMDRFAPEFYDHGVLATIGKGERNHAVCEACKKNRSVTSARSAARAPLRQNILFPKKLSPSKNWAVNR